LSPPPAARDPRRRGARRAHDRSPRAPRLEIPFWKDDSYRLRDEIADRPRPARGPRGEAPRDFSPAAGPRPLLAGSAAARHGRRAPPSTG
jgi:hypothetical protein